MVGLDIDNIKRYARLKICGSAFNFLSKVNTYYTTTNTIEY